MAYGGRLSFRPWLRAAFGVVVLARAGAPLALLFGLFSLVYGVSQIVLGVPLRQTGRSVMEKHAA